MQFQIPCLQQQAAELRQPVQVFQILCVLQQAVDLSQPAQASPPASVGDS